MSDEIVKIHKTKKFEPHRRTKIPIPTVIEAIKKWKGYIHLAAKSLGISHVTLYKYAQKYPEIQEVVDATRGELLDIAETKLYDAVARGEPWAVAFTLRTLGASRGYGNNLKISGNPDAPVEVVGMSLSQWESRREKAKNEALETLSYFNVPQVIEGQYERID